MKKSCNFIKTEKGQAVVEAALILPLLLLFLCMMIDVGRIVYAEARLNSICQASVRIAGLGGSDSQIYDYAHSQLDSQTASTLEVYPDPLEAARKSGDFVTVKLSVDINYLTPLANVILSSPFHAVAQSTIRIE